MGHRPQIIANFSFDVDASCTPQSVFGEDCCGGGGNNEFFLRAAEAEGTLHHRPLLSLFALPINSEPMTDEGVVAVYEELGLRRPRIDQAVHFAGQFPEQPLDGEAIVFYVPCFIIDPAGGRRTLSMVRSRTEGGQMVRELHCCAIGATYAPSYTLGTGKDQKVTRVLFAGVAPN